MMKEKVVRKEIVEYDIITTDMRTDQKMVRSYRQTTESLEDRNERMSR